MTYNVFSKLRRNELRGQSGRAYSSVGPTNKMAERVEAYIRELLSFMRLKRTRGNM
jgi:hypothetical protein